MFFNSKHRGCYSYVTTVYTQSDASSSAQNQFCVSVEFYLLELTKTAVFFIFLKKALSHSPWVSGVREQETTMKSLSETSVSRGTVQQRREEEEQKGKAVI